MSDIGKPEYAKVDHRKALFFSPEKADKLLEIIDNMQEDNNVSEKWSRKAKINPRDIYER